MTSALREEGREVLTREGEGVHNTKKSEDVIYVYAAVEAPFDSETRRRSWWFGTFAGDRGRGSDREGDRDEDATRRRHMLLLVCFGTELWKYLSHFCLKSFRFSFSLPIS